MFTTGSKLLIGATLLAGVLTAAYGVFQGGALGTIGLVGATAGLALLAAINVFARDSNVSAMDHDAFPSAAAAQAPARNSAWPVLMAVGAATVTVGLVTYRSIFILGVIALAAGALEWLAQSWSERASADREFNADARNAIIDPLELPVAGAAGAGILVFAFSRVMLGLPSKSATVAGFAVAATVVLAIGTLIGFQRKVSKPALTGLFSLGAIAVVAGGAFAGLSGPREIHEHETPGDLAEQDACTDEHMHADENASQTVANKSNLTARITFDGTELHADVLGIDGDFDALTIQRANPTNIVFRNESGHDARLVIDTHRDESLTFPGPARFCTALTADGGVQSLTFSLTRSTRAIQASGVDGFQFVVPGTDATLPVIVP